MIAALVGPPLLAAIWMALQIESIRFLVVIGFATALAFLIGIGICLLVLRLVEIVASLLPNSQAPAPKLPKE